MWYYQSKQSDAEVIEKLGELAEQRPNRGFDNYYGRIRNSGLVWNRKRVLRIYRLMGLTRRRKVKKRLPMREKEPLEQPKSLNISWSADFMSDSMENGRQIRIFNIIDDFNREALWIDPGYSYPSQHVVRALEIVSVDRKLPHQIRVDNGPEFLSKTFLNYCNKNGITIKYIQPGKPTQNAYVERFNRLFREDVLDAYIFSSMEQVRIQIDEFKEDYNQNHPHKSLGGKPPCQFKYLYDKEIMSSESVKAKVKPAMRAP